MAGAGFLPWGASGRAERHSYALVGVADRLDVLHGVAAALAASWYLAPLLAAGSLLAATLGHRAVAHGLAAVVALGGTALALAVRASPLVARVGPYATIAAAGVVGLGQLLALAERGRNDDR